MNSITTAARRVHSIAEVLEPGDFYIPPELDLMFLWLPGDTLSTKIRLGGEQHPCWSWDGNMESPTLRPSLNLEGIWHGFLNHGVFQSC